MVDHVVVHDEPNVLRPIVLDIMITKVHFDMTLSIDVEYHMHFNNCG